MRNELIDQCVSFLIFRLKNKAQFNHLNKMSETKCCIHLNKVPNSLPVRVFTETTLAECHFVRQNGRCHNIKHKNVTLPDKVNAVDGYHISCYRSFTCILTERADRGTSDTDGKPIAICVSFEIVFFFCYSLID